MPKILVTGPFGQLGSELIPALQAKYGKDNVVALGHNHIPEDYNGSLEKADITDVSALRQVIQKHSITVIYHLAALLSAVGQKKPQLAWDINLIALKNLFDLCLEMKIERIFWASSMAVFGPTTPKKDVPQSTVIEPISMYGITKHTGELLSQYYFNKFGLDVRSIRYPGIISWKAAPGGGTTDYAIAIFHGAIQTGSYECFVSEKTSLPMIYIDDAIKGTIQLMEAASEKVKVRTSYNMGALEFTAEELAALINKRVPLKVEYKPDQRQKTADSWPASISDKEAREDWGWSPQIGLEELVDIMVDNLKQTLKSKPAL